eukprot:Sro331_g119040.4  (164) ;mRNA; r:14272-14763
MGPGIATSQSLQSVVLHKLGDTSNAQGKVNDCLTYMLQDNTSLEHFELPAMTGGTSPRWVQMASTVLQKNTKLRVLHLGGPQQQQPQPNNTTSTTEAWNSVQFHLKLNAAGRSRLLGQQQQNNDSMALSSNREWVHVIGNVADDLDCVFYFLSRNPSLCGRQL